LVGRVKPWLPVVVLLVASTAWGLTWLPLKHFGDHGIRGVWVTLVAHGSVGLLALPLVWRTRRRWLASWRVMVLLAVFGGLANLAFATAIVSGDVLRVMALFYLLPAWGVIGGRVLLGEVIDRSRQLSLVGALLGAFLVLGGSGLSAAPPTWIEGAALASGMALGLHNVLLRKAQAVPVVTKVGFGFVGCLCWAAAFVVLGAAPAPRGVPSSVWIEVVGFGVVWILLATVGTMWGVHHLEAGRSSVLIIIELVTAVVSAALLNERHIATTEWLGGALIVAAALIEARRPAQSRAITA
jgi:drug/metabolite transporter (DMT)-like permease